MGTDFLERLTFAYKLSLVEYTVKNSEFILLTGRVGEPLGPFLEGPSGEKPGSRTGPGKGPGKAKEISGGPLEGAPNVLVRVPIFAGLTLGGTHSGPGGRVSRRGALHYCVPPF